MPFLLTHVLLPLSSQEQSKRKIKLNLRIKRCAKKKNREELKKKIDKLEDSIQTVKKLEIGNKISYSKEKDPKILSHSRMLARHEEGKTHKGKRGTAE